MCYTEINTSALDMNFKHKPLNCVKYLIQFQKCDNMGGLHCLIFSSIM